MQYESITDNHYFGGDWENDILLLFEDASIDINLILVWKLCITPPFSFLPHGCGPLAAYMSFGLHDEPIHYV